MNKCDLILLAANIITSARWEFQLSQQMYSSQELARVCGIHVLLDICAEKGYLEQYSVCLICMQVCTNTS